MTEIAITSVPLELCSCKMMKGMFYLCFCSAMFFKAVTLDPHNVGFGSFNLGTHKLEKQVHVPLLIF